MIDGFNSAIDFDLFAEPESFLKRVPAKGAVYLFVDEADRPIQLLCVGNLRQSLKRRLFGEEQIGPSRRVNYRDLVRHVHWRRVDSGFEADWIYYEAARLLFPRSYQGMLGFRHAWFVHVDPKAAFPRYLKTMDLAARPGRLVGPFEDKHAAARWIQMVEDAFDLCRYYNVLLEAPRARACAYKEMGRCPAPCDGSIDMEQYRNLIEWSLQVGVDPSEMVAQQTQRMQDAARGLHFESAGRIKAYLDQISVFGKGAFRYVRPLSHFQYISVQRGPRTATAKVFLITPGVIQEMAGLIAEPVRDSDLLREIFTRAADPAVPIDTVGTERVGVVAHHLFGGKRSSGVFIPLDQLDYRSFLKAFREVARQEPADEEGGEGLVKELQAL